ncbi:MAG: peptide ABC transporter permease [Bdellovibrionaceae bacterium]|nr:peptide ABC transporter permease [Pseudobdellovibrionaceae bacterium]|tara:strand:- start:13606 stop:14541 length:936 start_codon:yes stop_codon:yes gene_type:complete
MLKYTIRRILYVIPILFGVTLVCFLLFNVAGGDPAAQAAGKYATVEQIESIRAELGLNQPIYLQYLDYLKQILTFDFGRSWSTKQKISEMFWSGVGPSLSVTVPGFLITLMITIPLSLVLGYLRDSFIDRTAMVVCLALISISSLVYILAGQYFLAYLWGMFPISGWDSSWTGRWEYTTLPILIMVVLSLGGQILFFRTIFIEELSKDYVRTARAKGLSNKKVLTKHILRNALIPIITLVVLQVPFLILGSLLLESFFGIPGLGGLLVTAINNADFPVIKAMIVILTILYTTFNLISDLLYAVVDPKVRLQ